MSQSFLSNYPDGFKAGVLLKEILGIDVVPGKVFWVGNNATPLKGEISASDANPGYFLKPLSTIDAAINLCAAGRNDVIFVRPSHAETIDAATDIVMDVDAVHIIGLGAGEDRPILTFATATAAAIPVTGDNCSLSNMVFKCNIASQNHMIDLAGADMKILGCDFREGSATGLSFITADTADADSDRLIVKDCKFQATTAGNYDNCISLAKDFNGVRILNCDFLADCDDACIDVPAGGNAQVDLHIRDCRVVNLQSGQHAIQINGTGNSGILADCKLGGDTLGTIVDAGGLEMYNVLEHDGADQEQAVLAGTPVASPTLVDDANNILGVDDSNNVFASTNVAGNRDGSIIERLEQIQADLTDDSATNVFGVDDADNGFASTNVVANRDGSILERLEHLNAGNVQGQVFYVQKSLTSSAIVTGGVDVTGVASGGDILIEEIYFETDATGLAAGTNFTLEKDGGSGVLTFFAETVANLGANASEVLSTGSVTASNGTILDSGQKLVAKCTSSSCTGSGVIDLTIKCRRLSDSASVAAA